jgi:hypothetical protein
MGKCGAITGMGTPCKLPGRRNGRCWIHEDKHASVFQDELEAKPSANKDNFDFSDENNSGFADRSKSLLEIQETTESDEELSLDMLDTPDCMLTEDDSECEEELSFDLLDTPDGMLREDDSESDEELSLDMMDSPGGILREDDSEFDEELSLDMMDPPDSMLNEDDSESAEALSLDMMDTPGVILSEDAYEDFLRKSESDLMSESEIDEPAKETYEFDEELSLEGVRDGEGKLFESRTCVENTTMGDSGKVPHKLDSAQHLEKTEIPVQNQGQDKKTLVSTKGYKESADIDLLEKSPQAEKKQENDSIKKKGEFISFYTLGAIIFLMALILLTLYNT